MAAIRRALFAAALAVCLARSAYAKTSMELIVNSVYQSGNGGRQVYDGTGDQSLTLFEPVLYINSQLDHNTSVFGSAVFDAFSSASAKAFDSGTGASRAGGGGGDDDDDEGGEDGELFRGWQTRAGFDVGASKRLGAWQFTPTAGYSTELSYRSVHGGLNAQRFFAEDNFVLSAGFFHYADEAKPWDVAAAAFSGFKPKTTNSLNASATQLLSEREILLGGFSYTRQGGYLEGTRNTVSTGTVTERADEVLPQQRDKFTANARYVRSLSEDLAFHLDYRYYTDSWEIRAHTLEPSLAASFADDKGVLRVHYRRYSQTAARYYSSGSYAGLQPVMTSDSDLAKFGADEGGVQVSYSPEAADGARAEWTWGGSAVYYKRSNDLKAVILQFSAAARF